MKIIVAGIGLLNPMKLEQEKYLIPQRGSTELVRAVLGGGAFYNANHLHTLGEEHSYGKKSWEAAYESKLKGLVSNLKGT